MIIKQVIVFSREDLERISRGQVYAFMNPGDNQEMLIMVDEKYEEMKEDDCGFLD